MPDPELNLVDVTLQTQTAPDINTQYNFITHRPATGVPPRSVINIRGWTSSPRGSVIHSAAVGTHGSFFIGVSSFYKGARHSPGPQKRQIPQFTAPQTSVAEQHRRSAPSPPIQMFTRDRAQHRKPLKSKSISQRCGKWGGTNLHWRPVEGHAARGGRRTKYKSTLGNPCFRKHENWVEVISRFWSDSNAKQWRGPDKGGARGGNK